MSTLETQVEARPIGQILMDRGILDQSHVEAILDTQKSDDRPFGLLAEKLFGIPPEQIEEAWAEQYRSYATDLDLEAEPIDPSVVGLIDRRRAWQFELVPVRSERDELVVATTPKRLQRAVVFAWRYFGRPVYVTVCDQAQMARHLQKYYSWT